MGVTLLLQCGLLALAGTPPGLTAWIESHLLLWGGEFWPADLTTRPEGLMGLPLLGLVFGIIGAACFPGLWWAGLVGLLAGLIAGGLINAAVDAVPSDILSSEVLGEYGAGP